MKANMGAADRIIRLVFAAIFALLFFTETFNGSWGIVLMAIAVVLTLTSFVSFCPLYALFGFSTCPNKK
jgi:hypothetical protein